MPSIYQHDGLSLYHPTLDAHTKSLFEVMRTGGVYYPFIERAAPSNEAIAANTLYATPFVIARDITIDRLLFQVGTGDIGKVIRVGIYRNGTNLYPSTLVKDGGEVSVATTGVKTITLSPSVALVKGIYHGVWVSDGTPSLYHANFGYNLLGLTEVNPYAARGYWSVAFTYAALPATFTAGGAVGGGYYGTWTPFRVESLD